MTSQVQLLNKILETKDYSIITLNGLTEDFFYNYKAEFRFIKSHYEVYGVVPDKLTFADAFPEFDFVDVQEPISFLLSALYKDYNTSYIAANFNEIKKLIESGKEAEAEAAYRKGVENLHAGIAMTCTDLTTDTSRYDRYLERTADNKKYRLSTGFAALDQLIGGIDRENDNMVIIARTGVGKTQMLLKMATEASKQGLRVGIYEGEMTADKVGYRIDTFLGNIRNTSLNRGDAYIQKEYKHYIEGLAASNYGPIKVLTQTDVPTGIVTVDTLRTFIEQEQLDILFVDQYDLLDDTSNSKVESERIGNIAKAIKKLQVEKKIPIISVSQMNRTKNDDGSQDTTQVAGSDKIGRYATVIIALEQKLDEEHNAVKIVLNIIKARDGGDHNKLTYFAWFNTGEFQYIPTENDGITTQEDSDSIRDSYEPLNEQTGNVF